MRTYIRAFTSIALLSCVPAPAISAQDNPPRPPQGHIVEQHSQDAERSESDALPFRERLLQSLIYTNLTVDFDDAPVDDVFNHLRETLDMNLMVRWNDDAVGFGIDPLTTITLNAEETPALEILEMVLEQCSDIEPCSWQLRRGFLEVGTKERLDMESAQELRVYPVADLLFEPPNFDDAPSFRLEDELGYGVAVWPYSPWLHNHNGDGDGRPGRPGHPGRPGRDPSNPRRPGGGGGGGVHPGGISMPRGTGGGGGGFINTGNVVDPNQAANERQRADELIELITAVVEPDAWEVNGGAATIEYRDGSLFVRAPDYVHRGLQGVPKVPPPDGAT